MEKPIRYIISIITYNPDLKRFEENIKKILSLVKEPKIVVIDNHSECIDEIKTIIARSPQCNLIINEENFGIATALNQAFQFAKEQDFYWVLTLDQDSEIPDNIFSEYENFVHLSDIAILCPVIFDVNAGVAIEKKDDLIVRDKYDELKKCITSGSLNLVAAWEDVGGFDDKMFIDGVDFDYCYRIRQQGYKIARIRTVLLKHKIGQARVIRLFGKEYFILNHGANRKFYIMRNRVYCDFKHYKKIKFSTYLYFFKASIAILLFEKCKNEKLKATRKGFREGILLGKEYLKN